MLKTLFTASTLAITAIAVQAQSETSEEALPDPVAVIEAAKSAIWESSRQQNCIKYSNMPGTMLDFRRDKSTPMSVFMGWANDLAGTENLREPMRRFRVDMVRAVYDAPLLRSDDLHAQTKAALTDRFFAYCFDNWEELSNVPRP